MERNNTKRTDQSPFYFVAKIIKLEIALRSFFALPNCLFDGHRKKIFNTFSFLMNFFEAKVEYYQREDFLLRSYFSLPAVQ